MSSTDLSLVLPVIDGTLTLDSNTAPEPVFADQLSRLNEDARIVVENATRNVSGETVTVTGTAKLFGSEGLKVTAVATDSPDGPALTIRFTTIDGNPGLDAWRFSDSFPNLPAFRTGQPDAKGDGTSTESDLLDRLLLSDAGFVLANAAASDPLTGAAVPAGLSFVAWLDASSLLGLLGSLAIGGGKLLLAGPVLLPRPEETTPPLYQYPPKFAWQADRLVPGIHLCADLGIDATLGEKLHLHSVGLRIYSPTSQSWASANPTYTPALAASAKLEVPSAGIALDMTALGILSPEYLNWVGLFDGVSLGRLAELLDLAGADDLAQSLPEDVQAGLQTVGKLSLEAATLQLGKGFKLASVGMAVGIPQLDTQVLPGFRLGGLVANFQIGDPFGAARSLSVTLDAGVEFVGAPFDIELELPSLEASARLRQGISLPLGRLFTEVGLPAPPADLSVETMEFYADKDGSLSFSADMAASPGWTLELGPGPFILHDVRVLATRPAGSPPSGNFSGSVAFGDFDLSLDYQTPGDLVLRGELEEVKLLLLASKLSNQPVRLPAGFDLTLTDNYAVIRKEGADLSFLLATTMEELGTVAFQVRRLGGGNSSWGFAAGVDLSAGADAAARRLSALPGLSGLKIFEDIFRLDELVLVVSSFDDPEFSFPNLDVFDAPAMGKGKINLPSGGGVIAGLNAHARWTLDTTAKEQKLLRRILGLNPSLGITLQIGLNPAENSRLYTRQKTTLAGLPLSCELGGQIVDRRAGLFLTGTVQTRISGKDQTFDVTMLLVANGALFSGSMVGTVMFEGIQLSNLALVAGCDWEGIPSLGVAATLVARSIKSSLAVFFDSTDPSRSLLAGSLSELSLKDVLDTFAGPVAPSEVDAVLGRVALLGTSDFTLDAATADALDNLRLEDVSKAFKAKGVKLPGSSAQVLLNVAQRGGKWFLTDLTQMLHYQAVKTPGGIRVTLEPQLYCAPQATTLGGLRFDEGFFLNSGMDILGFRAMAKVFIKIRQGIAVDGSLDRIVIGGPQLFCLESADGSRGPHLSAATFRQPTQPNPDLQSPHFLLDGRIALLGLKSNTYVKLSSSGFIFDTKGSLPNLYDYNLKGRFAGPADLGVGGDLNIKVGTLDFGPLGKITIGSGVAGKLDVGVGRAKSWARFTGGFELAGKTFNLPPIDLDVNSASLLDLPTRVIDEVRKLLSGLLGDPRRWSELALGGAITGISNIPAILESQFRLPAQEAQRLLSGLPGGKEVLDAAAKTAADAAKAAADAAAKAAADAAKAAADAAKKLWPF